MQETTVNLLTPLSDYESQSADGAGNSAVSWSSIIAGALAIAVTSLMLVTLGGGIGLTLGMSPDQNMSAGGLSAFAVIWLIVTQWIASGIGGYMTGRLRTKWTQVHTHEVFFRDTAHGFMAWATATLFGILVLSSTAAMLGHGVAAIRPQQTENGQGMRMQSGGNDPLAAYIDSLYRPAHEGIPVSGTEGGTGISGVQAVAQPTTPRVSADVRAETGRILMSGMGKQGLAEEDKTYLAQLISSNTDLSAVDASKRIDDVLAKAHEDMKKAAKAAGYLSLFAVLSMMIGAFVASVAAAYGGSQRDEWEDAVRAGTYGNEVRRRA